MMDGKYNPLLVFTTFNQLDMTRKCLEYAMELDYDILVIDDNSDDGTKEYLAQIQVETLLKDERKGLTDSWNWAYKYWKISKEYSNLVLCNNDVLIPKGAIEGMMSDHALVVPMCNESGAGYACKEQSVEKHYVPFANFYIDSNGASRPLPANEQCMCKDESDINSVQNGIKNEFNQVKCWTGFCMCMSRGIIEYELLDGNLFNPANINTGNDDDLAKRVQAYIALGSFVYHFKGTSFNGKIGGRNDLSRTY